MKSKKLILLCVFALVAASCVKKQIPADEGLLGLDYYPTTSGKFVEYDVDSIVYTEIPRDTITYTYRIKEKLSDRFTDNEGREAIRLERYIKKYNPAVPFENMSWQMKEVWMVNADKLKVQVQENNLRYTKLIFPIEENASWNGNAANTLGEQTYTIDYIDKKESLNNLALSNVLMVIQRNRRTLISYDYHIEKYAKGVGLVQKQIISLLSNNIVPNVPVENRIESGLIYRQTLVTYGYE